MRLSREEAIQQLKDWFEVLEACAQGLEHGEAHIEKVVEASRDEYMRHADAEVRMWTAKVLLQGLRIFVPEPPLGLRQRLAAMELFVEQIGALATPRSSTLHANGVSLLESFASLRAFCLIFECEGEDRRLISALLTACLAAARADREGALEGLLARLLADVLDEFDAMPQEVIRTLLSELTAPRRQRGALVGAGAAAAGAGTPAQRASELVRRVLGSLAHRNAVLPINEFLSSALFSDKRRAEEAAAGGAAEMEELEESARASKMQLEMHLNAVFELFTIDAALVSRIFPNLQADLLCKEPVRRRLVTVLVGRMLAHCPSLGQGSASAAAAAPLLQRYPLLFDRHLERMTDADVEVRLGVLDGARDMLATAVACRSREVQLRSLGGGRGHGASTSGTEAWGSAADRIKACLALRCLDPAEEVRLKVLSVVFDIASSSSFGLALLSSVLPVIFGRILDKRPHVRTACAEAMAKLYEVHALPLIVDGESEALPDLKFAPRLLCEAFHVFAQSRLGHTSFIEELIEKHFLGCALHSASGAAAARARALVAFCGAALGEGRSAQGLALLLYRKRETNAALRRYLHLRMRRAGPVLEFNRPRDAGQGSLQLTRASDGDAAGDAAAVASAVAASALQELARLSPATEDRNATPEALLVNLRTLDAVRDKALWSHLERLISPTEELRTDEMPALLAELARLLRAQRLTELGFVLRRALLSTWLLPEHVPAVIEAWDADDTAEPGAANAASSSKRRRSRKVDPALEAQAEPSATQLVVRSLSKYFPGPFLQHAFAISQRLTRAEPDAARSALSVLSALGKHAGASRTSEEGSDVSLQLPELGADGLVAGLVQVVQGAFSELPLARGSICRKAVRALSVLPNTEPWAALDQMLDWVEEQCSEAEERGNGPPVMAMHLAAACLERIFEFGDACPEGTLQHGREEKWVRLAGTAEQPGAPLLSDILCASVELFLAVRSTDRIAELLIKSNELPVDSQLQLASIVLRPLRRGTVSVTTELLDELSAHICGIFAADSSSAVGDMDRLLAGFVKLHKPVPVHVRLADRLRLCVTLPTVFALAPLKKYRETVQRMLQTSMLKALRQSAACKEPYLDFAVACFIHFLSRLEPFKTECSAALTKYPLSSKVSEIFVEALLRCEPGRNLELAVVALRVCDRTRFFQDKELPASDAVQKAASVLRHVVEKNCPELGRQGTALLQTAERGSMPSELYAIRQDIGQQPQALTMGGEGGRAPAAMGAIADKVSDVARPMAAAARAGGGMGSSSATKRPLAVVGPAEVLGESAKRPHCA